jgi:O-acetylhomoserine (thiol)-lyase
MGALMTPALDNSDTDCRPAWDAQSATQGAQGACFDTLKVRAGYDPTEHHLSSQVPIYQSAAFCLQSPERVRRLLALEECHPTYSRTANPTVEVLEKRLAALHGVTGSVALSTGMAAVSHALMNVVGTGGRVLSTYHLYGGTLDGFTSLYPQLGIGFDAIEDPADLSGFARGIRPDTKAIFVESITNPLATVFDLEGIAALAHAAGIPLIVDNTIATPYLLNPFDFGADVVLYSATKALCGHGNALAGVVLERGGFNFANGLFGHFTVDPAQTTHYEVTPAQRKLMGLRPDSLRLSLGLEDPRDLIADLQQAFAAADQFVSR